MDVELIFSPNLEMNENFDYSLYTEMLDIALDKFGIHTRQKHPDFFVSFSSSSETVF